MIILLCLNGQMMTQEENAEANRARCRAYYQKNKEKMMLKNKKFHAANPNWKKEYEAKNKDKLSAQRKAWWDANKDKAPEYRKAWRAADPERTKAFDKRRYDLKKASGKLNIYWREYCRKNRPKFRAMSKKWMKENPERAMDHRVAYRTKKRLNGTRLSHGLTKRLLVSQNGLCAHCKADLSITKYHKDHIVPISKGGPHVDSNIQLLCPPCNLSKGNRLSPAT